jgi:hypothetical protein
LRTASFSYVSDNQFRCTSSNYAGVCLQNTYDYSLFGVGGMVCGAIKDKIIGNKELLKSGTNGFINEKLSDLEEKKTMDKQD